MKKPTRSTTTNYINAINFTALFRQRHVNHHEICLGLRAIVQNVARNSYHWPTLDDRDEAECHTLAHLIAAIDRFDVTRPSANAFSYFTGATFNEFSKQLARLKRQRRILSLEVLETENE